MIYGWAGTDLKIDLSKGKIEREKGDRDLYERYLGAKGTNARILWDRVPPEVEPFSPDNLLIIGAGVLDGTMVPAANRTAITFKSPVTGLLGYSILAKRARRGQEAFQWHRQFRSRLLRPVFHHLGFRRW